MESRGVSRRIDPKTPVKAPATISPAGFDLTRKGALQLASELGQSADVVDAVALAPCSPGGKQLPFAGDKFGRNRALVPNESGHR